MAATVEKTPGWVCAKCGWNNSAAVNRCIVCGTENAAYPLNPENRRKAGAYPAADTLHQYNRLAVISFGLGIVIVVIFIGVRTAAQAVDAGSNTLVRMLFDLFCFIPPLSAIGSIITGMLALRQIQYEKERGRWMAVIGIAIGVLEFILLGLMFVATVVSS